MKITYTDANGQMWVIHAAPKASIERDLKAARQDVSFAMTEQEYLDFIWQKSVPQNAINPMWVEDTVVPTDREFRDAWKQEGVSIGYDLVKAKEIQLKRLRSERNAMLDITDKELLKLNDLGDTNAVAALKIRRQALRDATNTLKNLTPLSIADIKNATPNLSLI